MVATRSWRRGSDRRVPGDYWHPVPAPCLCPSGRSGGMSYQPKGGEMLGGVYLEFVEECKLVAYGQRSPNAGAQTALAVLGGQPEETGASSPPRSRTATAGSATGPPRSAASTSRRRPAPPMDTWSGRPPGRRPCGSGSGARSARRRPRGPRRRAPGRSVPREAGVPVLGGTEGGRVDELRARTGARRTQSGELAVGFLQIRERQRGGT